MGKRLDSTEVDNLAIAKVEETISKLFQTTKLKVNPFRSGEFRAERGRDFTIELAERTSSGDGDDVSLSAGHIFYVQNKGSQSAFKHKSRQPRKGMLSHSFDDTRQLKYFCYQLTHPMIVTLCDITDGKENIYWCPIQLDIQQYEERIQEIETQYTKKKRKTTSITIYVDPKKCLLKEGKIQRQNLKAFIKDLIDSETTNRAFTAHRFRVHTSQLEINRKAHILDQVHSALDQISSNVRHVPNYVIRSLYPFMVSKDFYPFYEIFDLKIDNPKLFELFTKIKIDNHRSLTLLDDAYFKKVKDAKDKMEFVLEKLTSSFIYRLSDRKTRKTVDTQFYREGRNCQCIACKSDRLQYKQVIERLIDPKLKSKEGPDNIAYAQYAVGNYVESAKELGKAVKNHKKKNAIMPYVFATYNRTRLLRKVDFRRGKLDAEAELLKAEIETIDLDQVYQINSKPHTEGLIRYLSGSNFQRHALVSMVNLNRAAKKEHRSSHRGGWHSDGSFRELICVFAEFEAFIKHNRLYYDTNEKFNQMVILFVESLMFSLSAKENDGARLEHFNDWHGHQIIEHGDADMILTTFIQNAFTPLNYKANGKKVESISMMLMRFLDEAQFIREKVHEHYPDNFYFNRRHIELTASAMALCSVSNIPVNDVNDIGRQIVHMLQKDEMSLRPLQKYLYRFIELKEGEIDYTILADLLTLLPSTNALHEKDLLDSIVDALKKRPEFDLSTDIVERFKPLVAPVCPVCQKRHELIWLVKLWDCAKPDSPAARLLNTTIAEALTTHYTNEGFYEATIAGCVELKQEWFDLFIENAKKERGGSFQSIITGVEDDLKPYWDMLVNLCFKLGIELNEERFAFMRGKSDYYDWLTNMGGFDYTKFNPEWVTKHPTTFYLKEMSKHDQLIKTLRNFLRHNPHDFIQRMFLFIAGYRIDSIA